MKTILKFLFLFGIVATIASGCTKKEEAFYFKCKIDGVEFVATSTESTLITDGGLINGYKIDATTKKASSIFLTAQELAIRGAGDYELYSPGEATYNDENKVSWYLQSGKFTISKYNALKSQVTGSFTTIIFTNGNGETRTATEGTFFIQLEKDSDFI